MEPATSHSSGAYAFGPFVLDPVKRLLWRDREPIAVTAKTLDVLLVLIENRGRNVTKDELMDEVWANTAVNENNLVRQISFLRRALDQRPDQHDYIVTIPGHGYRFVADVREWPNAPVPKTPRTDLPESETRPTTAQPDVASRETSSGRPRAFASRPLVLAAGLAAVAAVSSALVLGLRHSTPDAPRRALQRITYDDVGAPREVSWAPDGAWIVYTSDRGGNPDLWKQRTADPNPERLTDFDGSDSQPAWSPDGKQIVFRSEREGGGLFVIPSDGGTTRRISTFGYSPQWSPDSKHVLFARWAVLEGSPAIYIVGLDGKPPRPLRPDVLETFATLHAAWHPDGRRVSVWGTRRNGGGPFVTVSMDEGPAATALIPEHVRKSLAEIAPGRFTWSPSRQFIYFEGRSRDTRNIWRLTVDPHTGNWTGGPEALTTGAGEDSGLSLSPDGARLMFTTRTSRTRLWAFPFDQAGGRVSGDPRPITSGGFGEVDVDTPPGGSKLAYRASRAGRSELWERSPSGGHERLLVSSEAFRYSKPRWSADGSKLAYTRTGKSSPESAVVVLDTASGQEHVLTKPGDVEFVPWDWSSDAATILGACRFSRTERFAACLMTVTGAPQVGGPTIRVVASDPRRDLFCLRFSADQRWISLLALDPQDVSSSTVYVVGAAGGKWIPITDGTAFDDKPRWAANGQAIYFVSNRSGIPNVWARRIDSSSGLPVGDVFPMTSFRSVQFMLTSRTAEMDIAVTPTDLLLPISESRGDIWMLDQVDR